jgi:RHS repeat-associated protein
VTSNFTFELCKPFIQNVSTADSNGTLTISATDSGDGKPTPITRSGSGTGLSGTFTDAYVFDTSGHALTDQRTGVPFLSFDATRDLSTGIITTSRDPNLLQTSYTYDGLGRLTVISPPGEAVKQFCYFLFSDGSSGNPFHVNLTYAKQGSSNACGSTETATSVTWGAYQYDGLGRVIREYQLMPNDLGHGSRFSFRDSTYDAAGNKTFFSEWTACIPNGGTDPTNIGFCAVGVGTNSQVATTGTRFSGFDLFGRPTTITKADGTTTTISYTDGGTLSSDLYEAVTINNVGGAASTTSTRKDPLGRVYSVVEPAVGGSADTTTYAYNVLDKVATVTEGPAGSQQTRSFTYDANGFLRSETNPENGTTKYGVYDALGDVIQKTEASTQTQANGKVVSTMTYEPMGRLTMLSTDEGRTYVQNTYDTNTLVCPPLPCPPNPNYPHGRLTRSIGSTFPLDPGPSVQEDFGYGDSGGRLSTKTTTIGSDKDTQDGTGVRDGESLMATENWTYNTLGLVSTYSHPRVSPTTYQETPTYTNGLPVSAVSAGSTVYSGAQYGTAGALWKWTDHGALQTTITPNVIPSRPASIAAGTFNTSTYAYDGAGNITAIGSDNFKYDARSRLASAFYVGQSATCTDSLGNLSRGQCFFYDRFGNLTNLTGVNPRTLTTSISTNQLTAQTYDTRGNMISQGIFDGINRVNGGFGWIYFYDGAGERVAKVPDSPILRREMAKVIVQARGEQPLSAGCTGAVDSFFTADVACSDPDRVWIDQIHTDGIASGYGGGVYGPGNSTTRGEMSAFLARGKLAPNPVPSSGTVLGVPYNCVSGGTSYFADVPPTDTFCATINYIASIGITQGCGVDGSGNPIYCPTGTVPETQMMAFTRRGWPNFFYVPRGTIYTLRNASGHVASEMMSKPGSTSYPTNDFPIATTPTRDNVFLGNLLVGSYSSNSLGGAIGWSYYHSDHLGTPRLVTGIESGSPKYWPYGDDVAGNPITSERLKFATMERDTEVTRYYDHARSHDFNLGRFLGVDVLMGDPELPQSWNRYAYCLGNPLRYVDPFGLESADCTDPESDCSQVAQQNDQILTKALVTTAEENGSVMDSVTVSGSFESPVEAIADVATAMAPVTDAMGWGMLTFLSGGTADLFGSLGGAAATGYSIYSRSRYVIGKMKDLSKPGAVKPSESELKLPNQGSPKANWRQNSSVLRKAMREGYPIRDASTNPVTGALRDNTGFTAAERNLFENQGWHYDPSTGYWFPGR